MTADSAGRPLELADLPELAKPREVAAVLRVGINAVYAACDRAEDPMPSCRLGPHGLRIIRGKLAAWLGVDL